MTATLDQPSIVTASDRRTPPILVTRRSLSYALGLLWLLDGALQLQSFMFTRGFAHQIIAPVAEGQPSFVSAPVRWNAELIAHQPALCNAVFAAVQLALGIGFLVPRTRRPAIVASVVWALGVWYAGEGLGGLAGGHVSVLVGAPGAAPLYALLAVAAWPGQLSTAEYRSARPPHWVLPLWAVLWVGAAVLDLLPGNRPSSTFSSQLAANAAAVPGWLARIDDAVGHGVHGLGATATLVVVGLELAIGLVALGRRPASSVAIIAGMVLAALYWAVGQSFGQLFGGQATDPSTGPLLLLVGLAALGASQRTRPAVAAGLSPRETGLERIQPVSASHAFGRP